MPAPAHAPDAAKADVLRSTGRGLRVKTRCRSLNEFFAKYTRMVDSSSIFIATAENHPVGARRSFSIELSDGQTVMRGEGEVIATRPASAGNLPGIRLKLTSVDPQTRAMHDQLLARMNAGPPSADTWRPPADSRRDVAVQAPSAHGQPIAESAPSSVAAAEASGQPYRGRLPTLFECASEDDRDSFEPVIRLTTPARAATSGAFIAKGADPKAQPVGPAPQSSPGTSSNAQLPEAASAPNAPPAAQTRLPSPLPVPSADTAGAVAAFRNRPPAWLVGAIGASAFMGLAGGLLVWHRRASTPPPPIEAAVTVATTVPISTSAPAPRVSTAPRNCLANIGTDPPGADVIWEGIRIGKTPLAKTPVPCGAARVTIERPPYLPSEKNVAAVAGATIAVYESLARPPAHLELTSTPAGAVFSIKGKVLGAAPLETDVLAFTTVVVVATHPGYKPWTKVIRTTPSVQTLHADLQPSSRKADQR